MLGSTYLTFTLCDGAEQVTTIGRKNLISCLGYISQNESILCNDMYPIILSYLDSGKDIKSWCLVSKYFDSIVSQNLKDKFTNHLMTLVKLLPSKRWDWSKLSRNPTLTWEIMKDNLDKKPLDWYYITKNKNITWDIIKGHPEMPWNWQGISENPNITSEPFGFLGTYFLKKVSSGGI